VELAVPARAGTTGPVRGPRRLRRVLAIFLVTGALGVAGARFVSHPAGEAGSLASAAPASPQDQIAALQGKVAANPQDLRSWQQLGIAYTRNAIRSGDPSLYDAARAAYDQADAIAPDDPPTLVGRGVLYLTLHRFADAYTVGAKAHAADVHNPDALAVMVDATVETGRYDEAAQRLQEMLDVRPGLAAYSRVSYLRELHGDIAGARAALTQAETAGSGSNYDLAVVVSLEGDLAFNHGDLVGAKTAYDRALALSADVVLARIGEARVAAAGGDVPTAIKLLTDVTNTYPLPTAVTLLGDLQAVAGDTTAAGRSYDLVRSIAKLQAASGAVTDLEMAVFEADHGGADAVALATAAYAARPTIYGADAMAWALDKAGRAAEAVPYVDESLRLGTQDALLHFHAATVLADAGDTDRARTELTAAFSTNPWFSFLHQGDAAALAARVGVPVPAEWKAH
jgi:tetratricopeptide (TPR) repeat protein